MNAKLLRRRPEWRKPGLLMLLSLVPVLVGFARLAQLAVGAPISDRNARFFAAPLPVVLHILAVIPYSILGALLFSPAIRLRWPGWHRAVGRILVVLGLMTAVTGLWMTVLYPWPDGDGEILYILRLVFGAAMAMAIVLAVDAIRRRDFVAHGSWMIRGYAIGVGAGTQVLTHIPYFVIFGKPDESSRAVLMGAGWVINVIVAEWIVRKGAAQHSAAEDALGRMEVPHIRSAEIQTSNIKV